jgi:small multidrug resistance pump
MTPTVPGWLLLACAIVAEVTASLSLKAALEISALYAVVATGYLGAFILLSFVLRAGMPLGWRTGCGVRAASR